MHLINFDFEKKHDSEVESVLVEYLEWIAILSLGERDKKNADSN